MSMIDSAAMIIIVVLCVCACEVICLKADLFEAPIISHISIKNTHMRTEKNYYQID